MVTRFHCPECGACFLEDCVCPSCLCDVLPNALHKAGELEILVPELTASERSIETMMRRNRGLTER